MLGARHSLLAFIKVSSEGHNFFIFSSYFLCSTTITAFHTVEYMVILFTRILAFLLTLLSFVSNSSIKPLGKGCVT